MKIVFFVSEDKSLGVGYLSSYLKTHGHQVYLLFDPCQFAKSYIQHPRLARYFSKEKYFFKNIEDIHPDLIGFSTLTSNYQWALRLARIVKEKFNIPIIFGGVHPTLVPEEVIREDCVDMVCIGEAEESLLELANNFNSKKTDIRNIYFKKEDHVIKNSLRPLEQDLDKYPFPDEELFYNVLPASYRLSSSVMTSRGCPFLCTYCANKSLTDIYKGQKYLRRRSVDNVLSELKLRKEEYKTRHFVFMDDIFSSDINWLNEFVPRYKKEIGLSFNCLAHPQLTDTQAIRLLKEAGCVMIDFGLQSGSPRLRKEVFSRFESNERMQEVSSACHRNKMRFAIDHIFNVPSETDKDNLVSAKFYNQIRPDIINCYSLIYFPKAEILNIAKRQGLLQQEDIGLIEEGKANGLYATVSLGKKRSLSFYSQYALFFSILPLLPKSLINKILGSRIILNLLTKLPLILLPFVKILVDLKSGMGFIPLSVLKNEIFFIRQHFQQGRGIRA